MDLAESGDLGPTLTIFVSVMIAITTIAVLLRLYVRIFMIHRFAADDYLIIVGQAAFLAAMCCVIKEVQLGLGKHVLEVIIYPGHVTKMVRYYFYANILFYVAISSVKIAIIIFFLYLCPPRSLRVTAITVGVLTIIIGLIATFFHAFHCLPSSYYWNRWAPGPNTHGHCVSHHTSYIFEQLFNASDMLSDFILAALPTIMVWNMKMSRSHKFGVSVLLGVGILSAISPFIRAFYLKALLVNTVIHCLDAAAPVAILSTAEVAIAITVVCVAQLRPLYLKISGSWSTLADSSQPTFPSGDAPAKASPGRNFAQPTELDITLHAHESRVSGDIFDFEKNEDIGTVISPV